LIIVFKKKLSKHGHFKPAKSLKNQRPTLKSGRIYRSRHCFLIPEFLIRCPQIVPKRDDLRQVIKVYPD
jgi:hypothetical protein